MRRLPHLSVIVPLAPGENAHSALVPELCAQLGADDEIVLVTTAQDHAALQAEVQAHSQVRCVQAQAGRARQLNAGAAAARNPWLWFLHADSRLTAGTVPRLLEAADEDYLGYLDLDFHDGDWTMRLTRFGTWLRCRVFGLPFGDQGFLISKHLFCALGRYDEQLSAGEDHALVWSARRARIPLRPLRAALLTSARKYRQHGWLQTTARHLLLTWRQARRFARS